MDDFEVMADEESIKATMGKKVLFSRLDRTLKTPMNFFLDEVEQQISSTFTVYWVENGPPEVFCLRGEARTLIVFSERYLELVGFARHLMVDSYFSPGIRMEMAERTCLKLIAELALRQGDSEFAVLAFLKSIVGKGIYIPDTNTLLDLELQPKNEAYMATWFYGLAHELGHVAAQPMESVRSGLFSDEAILSGIRIAFNHFPYPKAFREEALTKASKQRSESVLGIDNLRSEGLADIFAASILLKSTYDFMNVVKSGPFRIEQFIAEMMIFLNIIVIIQRCRQVAQCTSQSTPSVEFVQEIGLHPVAACMRGLMVHEYLQHSAARFIFNTENVSQSQLKQTNDLVNGINYSLRKAIEAIDTGMGRAMRFALFPETRERQLLEQFTHEISCRNAPLSILSISEAQQFCNLADVLKVDGEGLKALRTITG